VPITKSLFYAASFVKDRPTHYFFALERISHFTILFAFLSSKNASSPIKKLSIHGVEQAFCACGKSNIRTLPCAAGRVGISALEEYRIKPAFFF